MEIPTLWIETSFLYENRPVFFFLCFIDNFLSFHHSSLSVKWPHHQNNKDKRHYWVSFYIIKVSRGRDGVVLFSSYSFWSDESLCRIRMVEEKKVTVGWRRCVTHRNDIYLRGPIGKKVDKYICWTCTGFCMCIVHLCVCVCVSTCVVLCAIRSTVKQEVSTGQDRKKETRDDREPCGFSSSFAPSPPVSLFSTLANPWQCLPPQPPKRKVKKKTGPNGRGKKRERKSKETSLWRHVIMPQAQSIH